MLLLIPPTSYRAPDFLRAARALGVDVVVGSDRRHVLEATGGAGTLAVDPVPLGEGVSQILAHAHRHPLAAIVGTDDATLVLAAAASKALGLPHNDPESVATARDKYRFRQAMARGGIRAPWFTLIRRDEDPADAARSVPYPCVVKPLALSGSRGVIRADDEATFIAAVQRVRRMLRGLEEIVEVRSRDSVLCEAFIPGREVAVEGLLTAGRLRPLALLDKPDPLNGPFFAETLYVTPSRLAPDRQREVEAEVDRAASALGLREGPVHAELRINDRGAWIVELAARSIGGLCSRALAFEPGLTLEELILRHALGMPTDNYARAARAAGVMMIPVPRAGRLREVSGLDAARGAPAIDDVIISVARGESVTPLPEGDRYLGFIFASASEPAEVESALRHARRQLRLHIT